MSTGALDRAWAKNALATERAIGPDAMAHVIVEHGQRTTPPGYVLARAWYRRPLLRVGSRVLRGCRRRVL